MTRFAKVKKISDVEIAKPSEEDLYAYKDDFGPIEEFANEHPLNTKHYKNKMQTKNDVTSYCFLGDLMFSGYGDGLICCWDIGQVPQTEEDSHPMVPLLGHTNKINQIEASEELKVIFTASDDCTLR